MANWPRGPMTRPRRADPIIDWTDPIVVKDPIIVIVVVIVEGPGYWTLLTVTWPPAQWLMTQQTKPNCQLLKWPGRTVIEARRPDGRTGNEVNDGPVIIIIGQPDGEGQTEASEVVEGPGSWPLTVNWWTMKKLIIIEEGNYWTTNPAGRTMMKLTDN